MEAKEISVTAQAAIAAASTAVAANKLPRYLYPGPPMVQTTTLSLAEKDVRLHQNMLAEIANGQLDLARTHVQLADVIPAYKALSSGALQDGCTQTADATSGSAAGGAGAPHDQLQLLQEPDVAAVGRTGFAYTSIVSTSHSSTTSDNNDFKEAELNRQYQVHSLEDLHRRAWEADMAQQQGVSLENSQRPVVPDSTRPFTLTLTNGRDGQKYVVAHYEPVALKVGRRNST